jgi:hypothetical protein
VQVSPPGVTFLFLCSWCQHVVLLIYLSNTPWRTSRKVGSLSQEPLNSPTYTYFSRASAEPNPHSYRVALSMIDVSVVRDHHVGDRYVFLNDP